MRFQKQIAGIMSCIMILGILGGCGGNKNESASSDSSADSMTSDSAVTEASDWSSGEDTNASIGDSSNNSKATGNVSKTNGTSASTKPPIDGAVTTQVKEEATPKGFYDKIRGTTIRVAVSAEPGKQAKAAADAFYKQYGCKVKWEVTGWQEWKTKIVQQVTAGVPVDSFNYFDNQFANYVANSIMQPIDPYIFITDKVWDKGAMSLFSWNGKYYGMYSDIANDGSVADAGMIYYNRTMFEDMGEKEPIEYYREGKWDFAAMRKVAKAMTQDEDDNGTPDIYGFATWWLDWALLANGNRQVQPTANGEVTITLDQPSAYSGLQLMADLATDKSMLYSDQWADFFKNGRVAMMFERPWNAIGYLDLNNKKVFKDEIGVCPPPKGPEAKKLYAPSIMSVTGIPVGAKNPLGAAAFSYFSSQYSYEHRSDPDRIAEINRMYTPEHLKTIQEYMLKATKINSLVCGFGNWDTAKGKFWTDVMVNHIPPSTAVASHINSLKYEIKETVKAMKK